MGGDDNWQPDLMCEACDAPTVTSDGQHLSWEPVPYAICYVVTRGDEVVAFTTDCEYDAEAGADYKVQAVNEFGGLSKKGDVNVSTGIQTLDSLMPSDYNEKIYTIDGRQHSKLQRGLNIVRMGDGTTHKIMVE